MTRGPGKKTDSRAKSFLSRFGRKAPAAELDALRPDELQRRIREFIEKFIDIETWRRTKLAEAAQRESLSVVTANWETAVSAARGAA